MKYKKKYAFCKDKSLWYISSTIISKTSSSTLSWFPARTLSSSLSMKICAQRKTRRRLFSLSSFFFPWSLALRHQSPAFCARGLCGKNEVPEEEAGHVTYTGLAMSGTLRMWLLLMLFSLCREPQSLSSLSIRWPFLSKNLTVQGKRVLTLHLPLP